MPGCTTPPTRRCRGQRRRPGRSRTSPTAPARRWAIARPGTTIRRRAGAGHRRLRSLDPRELTGHDVAQRNLAEPLTGAVVLLVARVSWVRGGQYRPHAGERLYLHASFDRIDGLVVGADVRMAGVKVGSVTARGGPARRIRPRWPSWCRRDDAAARHQRGNHQRRAAGRQIPGPGAGRDEKMLAPAARSPSPSRPISMEQLLGKFIFSATDLERAEAGRSQGKAGGRGEMTAPPERWPQRRRHAVACREKLKMLVENRAELPR